MADVTVNVGALDITQEFASGYAVDGTQVELITADFTRQYPNSAQNNLEFSNSSTRIEISSGPGGSAHFSWDEPGSTDDDFVYRVNFLENAGGVSGEVMFCWTPDGTKANKGDGYSIYFDSADTEIREYTNGSDAVLAATGAGLANSSGNGYYCEVTFTESSGTIDYRIWRSDLSRPSVATLSTTDSTSSGGKLGFYKYGGNGSWIEELYATADGTGGTLEATGYNPTVNAGVAVFPKSIDDETAGVVSVIGFDPVAGVSDVVYPAGALGVSGYNPTVLAALEVTSGLGTLEATGYNPAVVLVVPTEPGLGTLEITGYDPVVTATDSTLVDLYFKFKDSTGNVRSRQILVRPKAVSKTTTYTAANIEEIILANATGGAFTITMPTAVEREGYIYRIKKTDASANAVKVDGLGAETIDGDADFDLIAQDEVIAVVSDNANWWII